MAWLNDGLVTEIHTISNDSTIDNLTIGINIFLYIILFLIGVLLGIMIDKY